MKQRLKSFVREQLRSDSSLHCLNYALWSSQARRDSRAVKAIAKTLRLQILDTNRFAFSESKSSKTLFILGSGSSINELTEKNFEEISAHVSVGINIWVAHDFIPDVYSFESTSLAGSRAERMQIEQFGIELSRGKILAKAPKILLLRPEAPSLPAQFVKIPDELRKNTFLYGRANLPNLNWEIGPVGIQQFLGKFSRYPPSRHVLPDNGASVIRLIFLGILKGFKKIVLVGVDLNTEPYFWYSDKWVSTRPELRTIFERPSGANHDTTETYDRPYNTLELIEWMNLTLENLNSTKLLVGSESSSLAQFLSLYPWKN